MKFFIPLVNLQRHTIRKCQRSKKYLKIDKLGSLLKRVYEFKGEKKPEEKVNVLVTVTESMGRRVPEERTRSRATTGHMVSKTPDDMIRRDSSTRGGWVRMTTTGPWTFSRVSMDRSAEG